MAADSPLVFILLGLGVLSLTLYFKKRGRKKKEKGKALVGS